jgi:NHLM bacteriocin system ABC transporter ATP-binding protein
MKDPGLALATTLGDAFAILGVPLGAHLVAPAVAMDEPVEYAAERARVRCRRVILDGAWWREGGLPMLARVSERRSVAREGSLPDDPSGSGWVVLLPRALGGYCMLAANGKGGTVQWRVDAGIAARLAPFAHTFHRVFEPRELGTRDVMRFAWSHDRRDLAMLGGIGLVAALIGLLTPIATSQLIDFAIPLREGALVAQVIAGLACAGLAVVALDVLRTAATFRFESRTGVCVQAAILDRIIGAPPKFFRAFSSGDLALRMGAVNAVQRTITGSTIGSLVTSIFLVANAALLFYYSPALALASVSLIATAAVISIAIGIARLKLGRRIQALDGSLGAMAFEYFAGISKLRAAAAEPRAFANWLARYGEYRTLNRASARLSNLEAVLLGVLQPLAALLVFWLAWRVILRADAESLSTGTFVAFLAALFALLGAVRSIVTIWMDLLQLKPVWDRAKPILQAIPEDGALDKVRHEPQGAIELSGVSFAYPEGPDVLSDIDLAIAPGEFVAIVGGSGSGKSTLIRMLLGFESPARGSVRYDGLDLAGLDLRYLRARLGTVLQGGRLWAGDLFTNIAGAANVEVETAWDAARKAGLAADIEAMPMGMYTLVGEGLSTLSGGQRQRVLIARALIGRPKILLLDEATSALDNNSQATVLAGLEKLEATRVVIAHRFSTIRNADRIVVLERGRIVEQGSFAQLAAAGGPFAAMLARQVA